jgi:hypothetical protein
LEHFLTAKPDPLLRKMLESALQASHAQPGRRKTRPADDAARACRRLGVQTLAPGVPLGRPKLTTSKAIPQKLDHIQFELAQNIIQFAALLVRYLLIKVSMPIGSFVRDIH